MQGDKISLRFCLCSPHRPVEDFLFSPFLPTVICRQPDPLSGHLLCKWTQSETQFQLCRVQPATDDSQIAVVNVKFTHRGNCLYDSLRTTSMSIDLSKRGDKRWRCAVMTMLCVTEVSQPKERRELGVPTSGLEQTAGVVQRSEATALCCRLAL